MSIDKDKKLRVGSVCCKGRACIAEGWQGHRNPEDFAVNCKLGAAGKNHGPLLLPRETLMKNLVEN